MPKLSVMPHSGAKLEDLRNRVITCERCPRLRTYCRIVAEEKRRAYLDWTYWGRPIPGFGDPNAKIFIVGLAPAAHGANRTGRIFTGDRSGEWLYRALFREGLANQPTATDADDGLKLIETYVTCSVRCAPPDNRPTPAEFENCAKYLAEELEIFRPQVQVFVALGALALGTLERELRKTGAYVGRKLKFTHGGEFTLPDGRTILTSYHPSQQNTFTGRLTDPMFQKVFIRARALSRGNRE